MSQSFSLLQSTYSFLARNFTVGVWIATFALKNLTFPFKKLHGSPQEISGTQIMHVGSPHVQAERKKSHAQESSLWFHGFHAIDSNIHLHDVLEQAKLTLHFTPTRAAIIKKADSNECRWGCSRIRTLQQCWWEHKTVQVLWKIRGSDGPPHQRLSTEIPSALLSHSVVSNSLRPHGL